MPLAACSIDTDTLIPDLLRAQPGARAVLDRYGLRGCGGPLGPVESLGFFARAHAVPAEQLLGEIRAILDDPPPSPAPANETPALADQLYRPFFLAGMAVVLTLGAVWGAYLLLRIGFVGSFSAAGLHEINAHGHAQIFGWVGLFVMGFAYQAFPRFKHTTLVRPRLALFTLVLMLVGIVGRCIFEPLAAGQPRLSDLVLLASLLEVAAILLFSAIIVFTWQRSGQPLTVADAYVLVALAWFVLQAGYEGVYVALTLKTEGPALVDLVATWQAPLRDIQIHGFALLMILGVSQRLFPSFYGFRSPRALPSWLALAGINLAVIGEVVGLVLMRRAGHGWAALWYTSVLLLAASVLLLVADWRLFGRCYEADRNLKFLRAAYGWLLISLAMLVLLPLHTGRVLPALAPSSDAARMHFSHAYYGAVRHAITVGFVSLMIMGVAAKVVPTLNGIDGRKLPALWAPFLLLNTGCALRVAGQTLTDVLPAAFPVAGLSGVLEVSGLALWACHLGALLLGFWRTDEMEPAQERPVVAADRVGAVLRTSPDLLDTFVAFGFSQLANPVLRRTVAGTITIAQACRLRGIDVDALLQALNRARIKEGCKAKSRSCDCCHHHAPAAH